LALSFICIVWSYSFFSNVNNFHVEVEKIQKERIKESLVVLRKLAISSCVDTFALQTHCETLGEAMEAGRFATSKIAKASLQKMKTHNKFEAMLEHYGVFYKAGLEKMPKKLKAYPEYKQLVEIKSYYKKAVSEKSVTVGMTSVANLSFFNLLRATFTHADKTHLYSNLLFLLVFGLWAEQRAGAVRTGLIFLAGSFAGIFAQAVTNTGNPVLGASAGISALMGAFFVFFFKAYFDFIFCAFLYFKRVSIPIVWAFPLLYIARDVEGLLNPQASSVAYFAHLFGLGVGMGIAFYIRRSDPLPDGVLFKPEVEILTKLQQSSHPAEIWQQFNELMKWNRQNWQGVEIFLSRGKQFGVGIASEKEGRLCNLYISRYMQHQFKTGTVKDIVRVVQQFPPQLPLAQFVDSVPTAQLLRSADVCAQNNIFDAAFSLYKSAVPRLKDPLQLQAIARSMAVIANSHPHLLNPYKREA
jgi:membrane associated rhomboid family serine protease